ncbi:ATP-binding protein [Streptomyces sp. NPDC017529]|uniref:ATP-binding protein n=1 Tax=Streptomyces sp. NPDC017529 TaxID=3365000 RepID=UPI0037B7AF73
MKWMTFTIGEHSARHVRRIVRTYLADWGMAELTDAAELGVTELLSNVVRHVPDRRCTILILRRPGGMRVEISDGAPGLPVKGTSPDDLSTRGRGLVLLDALVDRWGVDPAVGRIGKTVWFECEAEETPARPAEWRGVPGWPMLDGRDDPAARQ